MENNCRFASSAIAAAVQAQERKRRDVGCWFRVLRRWARWLGFWVCNDLIGFDY